MMEQAKPAQFSAQAPAAIVMVRPHHFQVNSQTATDNRFQQQANRPASDISKAAFKEISQAAQNLQNKGVAVHLFEDEGTNTPDSVFPNNWFSTHAGGHIAIYPMMAENRRLERRQDVLDMLKTRYRVQDIIDYSGLEADGLFLEGTGAMVLDHMDRIAYAIRSHRTDPIALERFCTHFNFEPMVFDAYDEGGSAVYHTNVLMCIATEFVMIGTDLIDNGDRYKEMMARLEAPGRVILSLTSDQIAEFAGNAIELQGKSNRILALSQRAYHALTSAQKQQIEKSAELLPLPMPTIELAGGSVRCTIAGIHLRPR